MNFVDRGFVKALLAGKCCPVQVCLGVRPAPVCNDHVDAAVQHRLPISCWLLLCRSLTVQVGVDSAADQARWIPSVPFCSMLSS